MYVCRQQQTYDGSFDVSFDVTYDGSFDVSFDVTYDGALLMSLLM